MRNALKSLQRNYGRPVVRITVGESARIAAKNPGPGLPLSRLPNQLQHQLREGSSASFGDLIEKLSF
jgi:hypothetical protein